MADSWQIHTLVFDLDDTLYPESDYVFSGFAAAGDWLREQHAVEGFSMMAGALFQAGRRGKIFDEALPRVGLAARPDLVAGLVAAYRGHEPRLTLFPDAATIIEWAGARFRLALITDGYAAVQKRKIHALGLESYIGCRVVTDELGREFWKPSSLPFSRVMTHFPGPRDGYVYVADNPRKDFIGARQLGWRTVRVRRPQGEHAAYRPEPGEEADTEVTNLLSLQALLKPAI